MRTEIDLDMAQTSLMNVIKNAKRDVTVEFIQEIVAEFFGLSVNDLKSKL